MEISAKGAAFVRLHEGFVAKWYKDPVGIGTIGCGFTWASDSFRKWWKANKRGQTFGPGARMSREEADDALIVLFREEYGKAVNDFLGKKKVPQHVFDGMASPVFNIGARALKWKWAQAIKAGDYANGAKLLRTTATTARGKQLKGLVRRRAEEADLIAKGVYAGVGAAKANPVDAMDDGVLQRGERGAAVAELIRDLAHLGFYEGTMDDIFGPGTERAVMAFQEAHGLKATGVADAATLKAIGKALEAPRVRAAEKKAEKAEEKVETAKDAVITAEKKAKERRIPEWLTGIGTALGGVIASIFGQGWMTVLAVVGAGIVVVALIVIFRAQLIAAFKDVRKAVEA